MTTRYAKTIGMALLCLYIQYFVGTHFFYHQHRLQWGVVTHSHPWNHNHSHSESQLLALDQMGNDLPTIPVQIHLQDPTTPRPVEYDAIFITVFHSRPSDCICRRGPPSC